MRKLCELWNFLRELSGQTAYERFCRHLRQQHPECPLPTEKDFYLDRLQEKYARPNRCC